MKKGENEQKKHKMGRDKDRGTQMKCQIYLDAVIKVERDFNI